MNTESTKAQVGELTRALKSMDYDFRIRDKAAYTNGHQDQKKLRAAIRTFAHEHRKAALDLVLKYVPADHLHEFERFAKIEYNNFGADPMNDKPISPSRREWMLKADILILAKLRDDDRMIYTTYKRYWNHEALETGWTHDRDNSTANPLVFAQHVKRESQKCDRLAVFVDDEPYNVVLSNRVFIAYEQCMGAKIEPKRAFGGMGIG